MSETDPTPPPARRWWRPTILQLMVLVAFAAFALAGVDVRPAAAITALSSLVCRNLTIRPKGRDDWTVVPNPWGDVVGPPDPRGPRPC